MLDFIIKKSIENRLVLIFVALVLLVGGFFIIQHLAVDVFPDITAPTVTVLIEAHGMAPEEVEMLVTFPIETAVNGAVDVRRVRSTSIQGFSTVIVEFDWGTDIYLARQIVSEKLQNVQSQLPNGVDQPVMAPITSTMGEMMNIGLTSDTVSQMELRTLADYTIRRRLLALPGVAQIKVYGGEVKQYQILVDPLLLRKYDLSLHDVHLAAEKANMNAAGGFYVQSGKEYLIRGLGRIHSPEELETTVVTTREHVPVLLRDVAKIQVGPATRIGTASINNKEGVLVVVSRQPDANTLELTERLDEVLSEIQQTLPPGIELHTELFKQSRFIERAVENVAVALRDGAILVVLILLLFLGNWRTTFISTLAIPLALVFSFLILKLFNFTINTMTLGGMAIAVGVLVDDAIIDVENVFRRLRQNAALPNEERLPVPEVVFTASSEVRAPIAIATFIIIVVFLPLFFLSGVEGRMLKPLGLAYVVSVVASLFVAVTVTPALAVFFFGKIDRKKSKESWIVQFLKKLYEPVLRWAMANRKLVFACAVILLIGALVIASFLGSSFLPEFNEGALNISIATVPGTSLEESTKIGQMAEQVLLAHPAITTLSRRTGRTEMDDHSLGSHAAELEAEIKFEGIEKEQLLEELRHDLEILPGTFYIIGQPISHRIDHMLSGTRANIAVKIFGPELSGLKNIAHQVQDLMSGIEGVADLSLDQQVDIPQVRIRANQQKMALYGLTMADIDEVIDTAFLGSVVSQVYEGQNQYDLVVRYDERFRSDLDAVKGSLVHTPLGADVPLDMVTDISLDRGPNYISRENVERKMVVQANVSGRDVGSVVQDIQNAVSFQIDLPAGYFIQYGGQFESQRAATRIISLLSLLSLLFIFFALFMEFKNTRQAMIVLINLPFALIGGIIAIAVTDGVMSIASLVGFITLFGIASRNGIILLSHYNHLIAQGKELSVAIVEGSLERLSPILMTGLTTGLALTPLAFSGHKPGNEIQSPLAIVVLGGLISATLLNLIVLPVLFSWWGEKKK